MRDKAESSKKPLCIATNYTKICPILSVHDVFEQAHYHIHECLKNYHNPTQFRFNLNSFIQALRNITFSLQSEKSKIPNFEKWYSQKQSEMRENRLLKSFVDGRNTVVKQGMLESKSKIYSGLFSFRREKFCVVLNVSPFLESEKIFEFSKGIWIPGLIAAEHYFIGEEIGIKREWVIESISEKEIIGECSQAWDLLAILVGEAHNLMNTDFKFTDVCHKDITDYQIMTETDLDPTLVYKWGWEDEDGNDDD